jgi:hypothetical protein
MKRQVDYTWRLAELMAARGMHNSTQLIPLLLERGIQLSLVVRGAVSAEQIRFPIPLSIRACGFPAHGLPMIFLTWLRSFRVADGAAKSV